MRVIGEARFWPETGALRSPSGSSTQKGAMTKRIEELCAQKGLRMTGQRKVIARVLEASQDHPDVEELHRRAAAIDPRVSLATVYRTVRLFEDCEIIERHDFLDGRSHYEASPEAHHDHLIDLRSGRVIEFSSEEIEKLQIDAARKLGFKLVGHRLELYGVPLGGEIARTAPKRTEKSGLRKPVS